MNSVRSNNLSLKYQSDSKDIEVKIFDFVPKSQFLYNIKICTLDLTLVIKLSFSILLKLLKICRIYTCAEII